MIQPVRIGDRLIGQGHACFIIAEAGVNHNGDLATGHKLIDAAVEAGADAVKFQSFFAKELVTPAATKADYQVETTGMAGGQTTMLQELELTLEGQAELKTHCDEAGILYLCTPYENYSTDMLEQIGVGAFKIASTDTNNIPFLRHVATKGRPVIISTGMSTLAEVELAIETLRPSLRDKIIILHCTSEYPAPIGEVNLGVIATMRQAFACPTGYSDHTEGIGVAPWAVAAGACLIEKHFTLDRNSPGPDHRASLEPDELSSLVRTLKNVEVAMGDGVKRVMPAEQKNKPLMQKSLVARRLIRAGEVIDEIDLAAKRPALGLQPYWFDRVVGKRAAKDIPADALIQLSSIDWAE